MRLSRRAFLAMAPPLAWSAQRVLAGDDSSRAWPEFTRHSRAAIDRGTRWLLRAINRDGGCGVDIGQPSDISCSAAVGLALLSQGNTLIEGPLAYRMKKLTRYLVEQVRERRFTMNLNSQVRADLSGYADHHFAAMFLSQAFGEAGPTDPCQTSLASLVETISAGQTAEGHWGAGRYPRLGAVTGWCSLRGAYYAGLSVRASAERTADYLIREMESNLAGGGDNLFANAAGVRVLYSLSKEHLPVARQAFDRIMRAAKHDFPTYSHFGGEQYLAFHFVNETMLQWGEPMWRQWFPVARDKLIRVQNRDGSWTGYSCITARTFCTACALLVLTSPNRYLPISQV